MIVYNAITERILRKCITEPNGCIIWTGKSIPSSNGKTLRGRININKKTFFVHRVMYENCIESLTEKDNVMHKCSNTLCVNPEHLLKGSAIDRAQYCLLKGNNPYAKRTHCNYGHPLSGDNLDLCRPHRRRCKICKRNAYLKSQQRKKEECKN